jgi:DNA-binding NtrC family response regulator
MLPVVMLVEDDPLLVRACVRLLGSPKYELVIATNPQQALSEAALHGDRLKVLVTDQNLNGLGEALADDLRTRHPELQVIVLSGDTLLQTKYHTIHKPFGLEAFRKAILEKLGLTE